jgi:hypothetical protein
MYGSCVTAESWRKAGEAAASLTRSEKKEAEAAAAAAAKLK